MLYVVCEKVLNFLPFLTEVEMMQIAPELCSSFLSFKLLAVKVFILLHTSLKWPTFNLLIVRGYTVQARRSSNNGPRSESNFLGFYEFLKLMKSYVLSGCCVGKDLFLDGRVHKAPDKLVRHHLLGISGGVLTS